VVRADALFGDPRGVVVLNGAGLTALDSVIDRIVDLPVVTDTEIP
jgi:hypothetical protein